MAKSYWVKVGTSEHGPYSSGQIRKMAEEGVLEADHLVSKDRQRWTFARDVEGLQFTSVELEESLNFQFEVNEDSVGELLDETFPVAAPICDAVDSSRRTRAKVARAQIDRQEKEAKRLSAKYLGAVERGTCDFCGMSVDVQSEKFVLYKNVYKDKYVGGAAVGIVAMKPKSISKFKLAICDSCLNKQRKVSADNEDLVILCASGFWAVVCPLLAMYPIIKDLVTTQRFHVGVASTLMFLFGAGAGVVLYFRIRGVSFSTAEYKKAEDYLRAKAEERTKDGQRVVTQREWESSHF